MTDHFIWWMGALHVIVCALFGMVYFIARVVFRIYRMLGLFQRILQWHVAKARWDRRYLDGLGSDEWRRGEPRP